jgi:hypothetical protein
MATYTMTQQEKFAVEAAVNDVQQHGLSLKNSAQLAELAQVVSDNSSEISTDFAALLDELAELALGTDCFAMSAYAGELAEIAEELIFADC